MAALFAFVHHLAAFSLVAAIAVEFVLLRQDIDRARARALLITDAVAGASAGVLLVAGLLRVFYFEKGAAFYFSNAAFIAKITLFVAVALLSIRPTLVFASWRRTLKAGGTPAVDDFRIRGVRRLVHWELAGVVLILFFAALMARGIGQLG